MDLSITGWESGLNGTIGGIQLAPWFTDNGVGFQLVFNNPNGQGNFTLTVVPLPAAASAGFAVLGGLGAIASYYAPTAWRPGATGMTTPS